MSLWSWIIGSSSLVLRSTASTMVRSSPPSALAATAGMIWRESGKLKRTVNEPSFLNVSQVDGLALQGHPGVGLGRPINDQLGVDLEVKVASQRAQRCR